MQHEQSVADAFRDYIREKAQKFGTQVHSFSLDGQDRDAGADYLFTDANRFAIVEFKYSESNLVSEKFKTRREKLCLMLEQCIDMKSKHDQCHFIAWTSGMSLAMRLNIYRHEICNQSVFGATCGLSNNTPHTTDRVEANSFVKEFIEGTPPRSLSLRDFEIYLAWLLTDTSNSTNSTLELLTRDPSSDNLSMVRLNSIAEAQTWLKKNFSSTPTKPRKRTGP